MPSADPPDKRDQPLAQGPNDERPGDDELLDEYELEEGYELEDSGAGEETVQEKFAREQMQTATQSLDVDKFYSDYERGVELEGMLQDFKFQFQIRHLMLFTAGLALALSLWKIANFAAMLLITVIVLVGAHLYIAYRERQRQEELQAERDRLVQAARNQATGAADNTPQEALAAIQPQDERPALKLQFSMKQVMIAITAACLLLAVCSLLPIKLIAAVFGVLAVLGIGAHAAGVDAPPIVMLGWWMILAAYIALSVAQQAFGVG